MKINTLENGLRCIWKEYQLAILTMLLDSSEGLKSGEIWEGLMDQGIEISRASVIGFLNKLEAHPEPLITHYEESGKGGFAKVYQIKAKGLKDLHRLTAEHILKKLDEIFKDYLEIMWSISVNMEILE